MSEHVDPTSPKRGLPPAESTLFHAPNLVFWFPWERISIIPAVIIELFRTDAFHFSWIFPSHFGT